MNLMPELLAASPELAILKALESLLNVARCVLVAANPELESHDFVREIPEPSVQACLGDAINERIVSLEYALRSYAIYVGNADARQQCLRSASKPSHEF